MEKRFEEITIKNLPDNVFHLLDEQWMLIAAGKKESFNFMTASWGSFGVLWDKPIATIFIRPHRHTLSFIENNDFFTLSFFNSNYKRMLSYSGQHSGRNVDKIKETGLVTTLTPSGNLTFEQARMVIECRKLYHDELKPDKFVVKEIIHRTYPDKDYHKIFIGEIIHCYLLNEVG
jgi:flavin reductase (DIM6/NTAB) family NADH-FMN oxidoreductase RutF